MSDSTEYDRTEEISARDKSPFDEAPARYNQAEVSTVMDAIPSDTSTVLDVGCGTGRFSVRLHQHGAEVLGVDFSRASLKTLRSIENDIHTLNGDAESLPVASDWAETILCTEVLQHVPSEAARRAVLSEFYRVAAPDATLVVSVFNADLLTNPKTDGYFGAENRIYYHRFTLSEIQKMLTDAGFTVVDISSFDHFFPLKKLVPPNITNRIDMATSRLPTTVQRLTGRFWLIVAKADK